MKEREGIDNLPHVASTQSDCCETSADYAYYETASCYCKLGAFPARFFFSCWCHRELVGRPRWWVLAV